MGPAIPSPWWAFSPFQLVQLMLVNLSGASTSLWWGLRKGGSGRMLGWHHSNLQRWQGAGTGNASPASVRSTKLAVPFSDGLPSSSLSLQVTVMCVLFVH